MSGNARPAVGVFDSGFGGLTVLRECVKVLPQVKFYYLGDNLHAPYGSRPQEEILSFVRCALARFQKLGVNAAVLACNTATAVAAQTVRNEFSFPVVGLEPAVKPAAAQCRKLLVLSTPRTAESEKLKALVSMYPERVTVFAAPRLAAAIEKHLLFGEPIRLTEHLPKGAFDGVVLGCTHYVFLQKEIGEFYSAPTFDGNLGAANRLAEVLNLQKIGTDNHPQPPTTTNFCSSNIQYNKKKKDVIFLGDAAKWNKRVFSEHLF